MDDDDGNVDLEFEAFDHDAAWDEREHAEDEVMLEHVPGVDELGEEDERRQGRAPRAQGPAGAVALGVPRLPSPEE